MSRKIALMLLVAAIWLGYAGCRKEGPTTTKKAAKAPAQGKPGTAEAPPPTSVGEQPPAGSTAQKPPAGATPGGAEANQPAARAKTQPAPATEASTKSSPGTK